MISDDELRQMTANELYALKLRIDRMLFGMAVDGRLKAQGVEAAIAVSTPFWEDESMMNLMGAIEPSFSGYRPSLVIADDIDWPSKFDGPVEVTARQLVPTNDVTILDRDNEDEPNSGALPMFGKDPNKVFGKKKRKKQ